jgi:chromosome segregation ATPase
MADAAPDALELHFGSYSFSDLQIALGNLRATKVHFDRFHALVSCLEKLTSIEGACREATHRLDRLRADEAALKEVVAAAAAAQAQLAGISDELARRRAEVDAERTKVMLAATAAAHDIVENAHADAANIVAGARSAAAAEAERQAAEARQRQAEMASVQGEIVALKGERDLISGAIAELRARINA